MSATFRLLLASRSDKNEAYMRQWGSASIIERIRWNECVFNSILERFGVGFGRRKTLHVPKTLHVARECERLQGVTFATCIQTSRMNFKRHTNMHRDILSQTNNTVQIISKQGVSTNVLKWKIVENSLNKHQQFGATSLSTKWYFKTSSNHTNMLVIK